MNESLIIVLSLSLSKKNKGITVETYLTNIKVNSQGKHIGGGTASINVFDVDKFENIDANYVKSVFKKYTNCITKSTYFISARKFIDFYNEFKIANLFYYETTEKKLFVINEIKETSNFKKTMFEMNDSFFEYNKNCILELFVKNNKPEVEAEKPMARIVENRNDHTFELFFAYNGEVVPYSSKNGAIILNGRPIYRNYDYENFIKQELLDNSFKQLSQGKFIYSGNLSPELLIKFLKTKKIDYSTENFKVANIKMKLINSNWFEINLSYDNEGSVNEIANKIDIFSNLKDADGNQIILPDSVNDVKEKLIIKDNKLLINTSNVFDVLRLMYDSNCIDDFYEYSNVNLSLTKKAKDVLLPYQIDGVRWLKFLNMNRFNGCLADDMGLGKTVQVLSFLEESEIYSKNGKILILVPKSLISNWIKEISKFTSNFKVGIYHGNNRNELDFKKYNMIITTYSTARIDIKKLTDHKFDIIIFDEIQFIKNSESDTSIELKKLQANMKIGLSGTPMENNLSELWNVMDVLNPGLFPSQTKFVSRYKEQNHFELKKILNMFILRRMKNDVLTQLPPKTIENIYCDMDEAQNELYNSIVIAVKKEISRLSSFSAAAILKGLLLLRQCCCDPRLLDRDVNIKNVKDSCKIEALKIIVKNSIESNHKILIFSQFTSMLNIIKEELSEYGDMISYLDGKTKDRGKIVSNFETSSRGIFLISIKAGGVGLNLTSAQDVVIYDPWWNPFVEQQAIDRVYRIGQNKPVNVYKLIASNSLEEKILDMQEFKTGLFDDVINGISTDKDIDLKDIINLL